MKTFIAFILSCLSVMGAETNDVRVFTSLNTNTQPGILITFQTFTRNGQTNLVSDTRRKDGVLQIRTQKFYHDGKLLGSYVTHPRHSSIQTAPGAPCTLSFLFDASNNVMQATINSNSTLLDGFACTNGVFYPQTSEFIRKAQSLADSLSGH